MKASKGSIIIRDGSAAHDLKITDREGRVSTFDLSALTKVQKHGVRELVVNYWCREHGFVELY